MDDIINDMFNSYVNKDSYPLFNNHYSTFVWHLSHYKISSKEMYEKLIILHIVSVLNEKYSYFSYNQTEKIFDKCVVFLRVEEDKKKHLLNVINSFKRCNNIPKLQMDLYEFKTNGKTLYDIQIIYNIKEFVDFMKSIEEKNSKKLKMGGQN